MLFKASAPIRRFPAEGYLSDVIFDRIEDFELVGPVPVDCPISPAGCDYLQPVWDQAILPTRRHWHPSPWVSESLNDGGHRRRFHYLYVDNRVTPAPNMVLSVDVSNISGNRRYEIVRGTGDTAVVVTDVYTFDGTPTREQADDIVARANRCPLNIWLATFNRTGPDGVTIEHCVLFNTTAYLMGDDGKTIERYRCRT